MDVQDGLAPRVLTSAMIAQRAMVPEDADAIERLFEFLKTARPTMAEIRDSVCEFYKIERFEIERPDRRALIVFVRQVFCFFAHRYACASLHQIARRVHIDHSTAHYSIRRIEQFAATRPLVRDDLDLIRLRIAEKLLLRRSRGTA